MTGKNPSAALEQLQAQVNDVSKQLAGDYVKSPPSYSEAKIIRDVVWGFHELDPWFLPLLDSPYLQRLRYLSQTALASQTYPCALHTRFEHSLGVAHATGRMLRAIERRQGRLLPQPYRLEVHLAGLLHDIGHGPFSHASEDIYGVDPIFSRIKSDNPVRFSGASPSEILAWCVLHSPTFLKLWKLVDESVSQAKRKKLINPAGSAWEEPHISVDRVGKMVLGTVDGLPIEQRPLASIVNGPFDADKLDYLLRDGYFTGLRVPVDVDRLMWGLDTVRGVNDDGTESHDLVVHATSLSAVEQVLFSRAQLYAQIYHHHKVRSSMQLIYRLLERLREEDRKVRDVSLRLPASFLLVDENDLLHLSWQDPVLDRIVQRIRNRILPKRAFVITSQCFEDLQSKDANSWGELRERLRVSHEDRIATADYIAGLAGENRGTVMIDIQDPKKIAGPTNALIYFSKNRIVPLGEVFPAEGWANAYEAYRKPTFFLTDCGDRERVANAVERWLRTESIAVNESARSLAKIPPVLNPSRRRVTAKRRPLTRKPIPAARSHRVTARTSSHR